jgi:hypothetical protein
MQQAAVAAALKGRKRRQAASDTFMTEMLDEFFESEGGGQAAERAKKFDDIATGKLGGSTVVFDRHMKKSVKHEKQIDGLMGKVTERMSRSKNYNAFASILVFAVLYVTTMIMQQRVVDENAVQTAYLATIVAGLEGKAPYTTADDILDWLQEEVVDRGWDEPICGDGTCEQDGSEYPGFGRFGCIPDCGRYLYTTKITVDLQTLYQASAKTLGWDLRKVATEGRTPGFTWNIYSYTMDDFLLEKDAKPEDG